jgi:hypothetical protein
VLAFEVGADGDPETIEARIGELPGVTSVSRETGERQRWVVHAEQDITAALAATLASGGYPIRHLRQRGEDLLELYRSLVPEGHDGRTN